MKVVKAVIRQSKEGDYLLIEVDLGVVIEQKVVPLVD